MLGLKTKHFDEYKKQFVCVPLPDYSDLCKYGRVVLCNKTYSSQIESYSMITYISKQTNWVVIFYVLILNVACVLN